MGKTCLALFGCLCLAVPGLLPAQDGLTILCEEDWPAQYRQNDGTLAGFAVEIVQSLQERVGNSDPIRLSVWENAYKMTLDHPNTLLFSVSRTQERESRFHWIGPLSESISGLFARKSEGLVLRSLEEARRLPRIGVYTGDFRETFLTAQGFTNLDRAPNSTLNFQKFLAGRVTAVTGTRNTFPEKIRNAGGRPEEMEMILELFKVQTYLVFSKTTSESVVRKWAEAFSGLRADGTLKRIYAKYLPGEPLPGSARPPAF